MVERISAGYADYLAKKEYGGDTPAILAARAARTTEYQVVRVDVMELREETGCTIYKYLGGQSDKPNENGNVYPQFETGDKKWKIYREENKYQEILDWCNERGWTIRQWRGGFRAFRYGAHPIRRSWMINDLRRRLEAEAVSWGLVSWDHPIWGDLRTIDLRYDLPINPTEWRGSRKEGAE